MSRSSEVKIRSTDYRGYTIVIFPSGITMIHEGIGSVPPAGKLIGSEDSAEGAKKLIDALKA